MPGDELGLLFTLADLEDCQTALNIDSDSLSLALALAAVRMRISSMEPYRTPIWSPCRGGGRAET